MTSSRSGFIDTETFPAFIQGFGMATMLSSVAAIQLAGADAFAVPLLFGIVLVGASMWFERDTGVSVDG